LVLLSLKTLANFRMEGVCLLPFVRNCVVGYLHHAQPQVRLEAVIASTRLLMDPSAMALRGGPSAEVVQHVLETLLKTALADPEPTLRLRLIHELDHATFNGWLKQPSHLALFVSFLCDEDLRVRLAALRLLGRLAPLNPAFALPPLRLTLTRLIAELQLQTDVSGKEEATRMLCEFLKADALRPLVQPLVRALVHALPLYGAVSPRLSTAALDAVGELCLVMGVEMAPYSTYLMPVIITTMHDASSTLRREVALRTLGRLVSSTGAVVKPYLEYPHLLPGILQVLREGGSSQPWSLKQEILRTLGLLGALDPYKFDALQALPEISKNALSHLTSPRESSSSRAAGFDALALSSDAATATGNAAVGSSAAAAHAQASSSSSTSLTANGVAFKSGLSSSSAAVSGHLAQLRLLDEGDSDAPAHTIMYEQSAMVAQPSAPGDGGEAPRLTPASEDYNPKVAVGALMKILRDPSLSAHHALVTQAVMHIFQNLGLKCVPFLNEIIPHMLHAVGSATEATMRESLLQQLAALTRIIKVS
jgi:FKBP12-rapamycin complex-associated protein